MQDTHSPYCPHCGKNMIFEDTVCPYCGEKVRSPRRRRTVSPVRKQIRPRENRNSPDAETRVWSSVEGTPRRKQTATPGHKVKWIGIVLVLLFFSGPILSLVGGLFGVVGELIEDAWDNSSSSYEAEEVTEETDDWTSPEYYTLSQEEYDLLDEGVIWEDQEQWDAIYSTLSRKEKKAMDALGNELRWGTVSHPQAVAAVTEEGGSEELAEELIQLLEIDWNTQALKRALSYLRFGAYTQADLQGQLEYEGYTQEQIDYALANCGADWDRQVELLLEESLHYGTYSRQGLIEHLEYKGADHDLAVELVDSCNADWYEMAVRCAEEYVEYLDMDREELISQLEYEQFTEDQILYAMDTLEIG